MDVHIHPAIKPFNSRYTGNYNLWAPIDNSCSGNMSKMFVNAGKEVPKTSQCHLEGLVKGNVKMGFFSLTPLEKQSLNVNLINEKRKGISTMACISGIHANRVLGKDEVVNYYNDLVENIDYVIAGSGQPYSINGQEYAYELVRNADHLRQIMQTPNRLAMVLNIEGGHSLGKSLDVEDFSQTPEYADFYLKNVDRIKGILPLREGGDYRLEYPFLSLNLNHFFWNGLGGHARTFNFLQNLVFNQTKGIDAPLTDLGKRVIERMLERKEGRRILIDVKHMSWAARQWYYDRLHQLHAQGDTVPIISSHSTIAGISAADKLWNKKDSEAKNAKSYVNRWTIGLCDEDVREIHLSKGIIGIMLDKYKLMGKLAKREMKKSVQGSVQRREFYVKVILANVLECIEAVGERSAWDIIAIGSDFDGLITPFEIYLRANDMPDLARDMTAFLKDPKDISTVFPKAKIQELMYGYTPEQIVRKIMYENGLRFALHALENIAQRP